MLARLRGVVQSRSSRWPEVRARHLKQNPACAVCGTTKRVEAHHVIPVHIDPSRELDPRNLITLCRKLTGGHHLAFGHLGDWKLFNPCVADAARLHRDGEM